MDDHHQEVIAYCREYGFHGLLADDAEYAAFDPPRYFSSENLKLTYKVVLQIYTKIQNCLIHPFLGIHWNQRIYDKWTDEDFESNTRAGMHYGSPIRKLPAARKWSSRFVQKIKSYKRGKCE